MVNLYRKLKHIKAEARRQQRSGERAREVRYPTDAILSASKSLRVGFRPSRKRPLLPFAATPARDAERLQYAWKAVTCTYPFLAPLLQASSSLYTYPSSCMAKPTRCPPSSERRRPQLSAKAPMRYKTICFSSRRMRPRVSPLCHYGDCGTECAVPMHPMKPNREVMHENAAAYEG
ncbi:hypothetical protein CN193_29590 [Sinorhizobium meliloti]|nr:hypothetical protein CN193_29590 [Sinorhizobium meliloti]